MKESHVHVGELIRTELNHQSHTVTWLAQELGIQRPNCYRILHARSLDTEKLFLISQILHHDFFEEYSCQLKLTH